MKNYKIIENYRDDENLRSKFLEFVSKVFITANFKDWYETGYWKDIYIPHSIVMDNKIVSNVSISKMKIFLNGKLINGIQFGTVGTIPGYERQGLSRYLMEYVLKKYEKDADLFFLFANDSVLNFYPKFGFTQINDSLYERTTNIPDSDYSCKQLSIYNKSDFELIKKLLNNRIDLTKIFGATDYEFITVWHLINSFPQNIYYLENEEIIVLYTVKNNVLNIWDIIYSQSFDFQNILPKIIPNNKIKSILFHFPPDQINYKYDKIIENKGSYLFIKGRFPVSGKPFKFPVTAET